MEVIEKTITLAHFFDNPTTAAAAGYDFNIIDCLSYAANGMSGFHVKREILTDLGRTEIADYRAIIVGLMAITMAILWPFFYPILGVVVHYQCRQSVKRFRFSSDQNVKRNINRWLMQLKD